MAQILLPGARYWVRYSPAPHFKQFLWDKFGWRERTNVTRTEFGSYIHVNTEDLIQRYLYWFGIWEPNLTHWITRRLPPNRVFVDIGANIGYYTLLAASLLRESGHVVAIEASPLIYRLMNDNISLNKLTNVRSICAAATAQGGKVAIYHGKKSNIGQTTIVDGVLKESSGLEIDGVRTCDLLKKDELQRARLVKIDVEGAEWSVLSGLRPAFDDLPNDVELIVEIDPSRLAIQNRAPSDIIGLMAAEGFHPYFLENDYSPLGYITSHNESSIPTRFSGVVTSETLLVFSRIDARELR